jgi:hypothetical protein
MGAQSTYAFHGTAEQTIEPDHFAVKIIHLCNTIFQMPKNIESLIETYINRFAVVWGQKKITAGETHVFPMAWEIQEGACHHDQTGFRARIRECGVAE